MSLAFTILLAVASLDAPSSLILDDICDVIELNHFYDDNGRKVFDQVLFFNWDGRRHQVLDWRLVKDPSYLPQRTWSAAGERWQCLWVDPNVDGVVRRVRGQSFRETWTQFDPELVEREELPKEKRQLLRPTKTLTTQVP